MDPRYLTNHDLLAAEDALDYKDPDLWAEIMRRAESYEPGITDALNASIIGDSKDLPDEVFNRACEYLRQNQD